MTPNLIINGDAENGLLGWEAEDGYPMPVVVEYGATDPSGDFPTPVSYTHLDVYKRQTLGSRPASNRATGWPSSPGTVASHS